MNRVTDSKYQGIKCYFDTLDGYFKKLVLCVEKPAGVVSIDSDSLDVIELLTGYNKALSEVQVRAQQQCIRMEDYASGKSEAWHQGYYGTLHLKWRQEWEELAYKVSLITPPKNPNYGISIPSVAPYLPLQSYR